VKAAVRHEIEQCKLSVTGGLADGVIIGALKGLGMSYLYCTCVVGIDMDADCE
jgi:hypothetical protein